MQDRRQIHSQMPNLCAFPPLGSFGLQEIILDTLPSITCQANRKRRRRSYGCCRADAKPASPLNSNDTASGGTNFLLHHPTFEESVNGLTDNTIPRVDSLSSCSGLADK